MVIGMMRTMVDGVDFHLLVSQQLSQASMNRLEALLIKVAAGDSRLIGHDGQFQTDPGKMPQSFRRVWQQFHLVG
jgi:hypothetical protein